MVERWTLRAAAEGSCKQLRDQAREQARLIRSGAVGELTEADVERDQELKATRREAAMLLAATAREAGMREPRAAGGGASPARTLETPAPAHTRMPCFGQAA